MAKWETGDKGNKEALTMFLKPAIHTPSNTWSADMYLIRYCSLFEIHLFDENLYPVICFVSYLLNNANVFAVTNAFIWHYC